MRSIWTLFSDGKTGSRILQILIIATGLLLLSCESTEDVSVEIDGAFTVSKREQIEAAGARWSRIASRQVRFEQGGEWLILPAPAPEPGFEGYKQGARRLLRIDPHLPDDRFYPVVLHELGHALGLKHTSRGVMDPTASETDFSFEDVVECERVGACSVP
jgi:hypothetical protein